MLPSSLTVSIVTYRPDAALLERCLARLALAIAAAREDRVLTQVAVALIDNSEDARNRRRRHARWPAQRFADSGVQLHFLHGHANVGYGVAHNLMLNGTGGDYQLVLNPDVELAGDALANAIRWLDANPDVVAVAPAVTRPDGAPDFLCKRYPAVLDLLLRGFAPRFVRRLFRERLERYELRDVIDPASDEPVRGVPVMSGCCMLVRRKAIDATGGFDPKFFLYFEDYDWSVRLSKIGADGLPAGVSRRPPRRRRGAQGMEAHRLVRAERLPLLPQARLAVRLMERRSPSSSPAPTASSGARWSRTSSRPAGRSSRRSGGILRARAVKPHHRAVGDLATASDATLDALVAGAAAIVHLAARAHVLAETAPDPGALYHAANVVATERLAAAAVRAGVRRFVFASTVKVHGEATAPGRPFRADDPLRAARCVCAQQGRGRARAGGGRGGNAARSDRAAAPARLRAAGQGKFPDAARRRRARSTAAVRQCREPARPALRRQSRGTRSPRSSTRRIRWAARG